MSNPEESISYIRSQLETKFIGRNLYYYPKVPSTNTVAKKIARRGAAEGAVVIADEQTAGRGRLGRTWLSPKGNLAMSIILKPALDSLPQLIMVASLAVVRTIKKLTDIEAEIKWPNDVLIKGKKVCGVLIESEIHRDQVYFAIIGIGINIDLDLGVMPEIADIATSLSCESRKEIDKEKFTSVLCLELENLYLKTQAGKSVYEDWKQHMVTLGKWVRVKAGKTIEEGQAVTVTKRGSLILRRHDGNIAEIIIGDVTVIKD